MREDELSVRRSQLPGISGRGTRSTLRLGPATGGAASAQASVLILPIRIGPHRLAIEAERVVEVAAGAAWTGPLDPARPVVAADLYRTLGLLAPEDRETLLARADGLIGRGPGRFVAFAVDRADRLVKVPLEDLAPLPPNVRDQLQIGFIAGVVGGSADDDGMAFLLDPRKIADAAAEVA